MKGLAIIPARGGSKTIPNKNLRFLAGKPLIFYCLKTASKSKFNLDIVVSTESKKISNFVSFLGYRVINRSEELSKDESTIDEVVFDIYKNLPNINEYDFLITIQPTSPLVNIDTIDNAIDEFIKNSYDTMISAVNHPHLSWKRSGLEFTPNYELRLNRQYLPEHLIETGAFVIFKPINLITGSRIYGNIGLMEVPKMESIDIDDFSDWIIAKKTLESKKIVIWTEGYNLIGMGHIYRTLLLYEKLYEHNVIIITSDRSTHGKLKFQDENVPFEVVKSQDDLIKRIQVLNPDILINDVLDTTVEFVKNCRSMQRE
jgi:CMP-N-acetylneuraminic acid synthetase